ncbi:DUF2797 domain-containing protein [Streptomyces sp. NBC_01180]|uniref:DUF2797 domain-containing protein n=1 Tax=Streptomyces sp. NBC_01180 TaxID=2903763 RepID=UPI003864C916|nr:DUF2797 domain-containing protein [Streptomyces sp. NBC_01180]
MWRSGGLRWGDEGPRLVWEGRARASPLVYGTDVGFRVEVSGERTCVGARGHACPVRARVSGRGTQARCAECARLDRAHSVAADTIADDPRVYRVYLAWFGAGMVKVGITAEERGPARLREQGAVAFSWLGRGPLMAARRTEELLRTALGVPDRIPYADKRAVRARLPGRGERAAEVREVHAQAVALSGWPDSLERLECEVADHGEVFGLAGLGDPSGAVSELVAGGTVAGRLVAAAGPDLHLAGDDGAVIVLDTRLMAGWGLTSAEPGAGVTVPVRAAPAEPEVEQPGLF